jgi:hypothetical protein
MRVTTPMLAAVVISTAVAGCGGGGSNSSTKHSTTPAAGASSHALPAGELGTYVRAGKGPGTSTVLTLSADGRYAQTIFGSSRPGIHGVWSFRDGRIAFTETGGSDAACIRQRGTYRWSYASKRLTLGVVSDLCGPRSSDFPLAPWRQRA